MKLPTFNHKLSIWLVLVSVTLATGGAGSGQISSLNNLDIEAEETKLTLQNAAEDNLLLREQLKIARQQIKSLSESLAVANSEGEVFKREATALRQKMTTLGIDAASPDKGKLEQRLLKAVSDLRIIQVEKDKLADQLVRLSEAMLRFVKTAGTADAESRLAVEAELRGANEALGMPASAQPVEAAAVPSTLTDGLVIGVKEELALVVANLGSKQGVKVGMPFQVWRGDQRIGRVLVVEAREKISGAIIQDLNSNKEKVKVGDRLRVDAQ